MYRFLVIAALLAPGFIAGAQEAEIKGTLTIAGKATPLTHALAVDFKDVDGMGQGDEIRVLLSDRKIAQPELESPILFNLASLAQEGKLVGVLLRFDPKAESSEVYGTTYAPMDSPQSSMPFFTLGGEAGGADTLKFAEGLTAGTLEYGASGDADFGVPEWSFSVTFSAPVKPCAPVVVLQGDEAFASPPFKTFLKFEEAMSKGDLDAIRKLATPEKAKQMDAYIAEAGKEAFVEMIKQMVAPAEARKKSLQGVFLRGESASIVLDEAGGKTSLSLIKRGDNWLMN